MNNFYHFSKDEILSIVYDCFREHSFTDYVILNGSKLEYGEGVSRDKENFFIFVENNKYNWSISLGYDYNELENYQGYFVVGTLKLRTSQNEMDVDIREKLTSYIKWFNKNYRADNPNISDFDMAKRYKVRQGCQLRDLTRWDLIHKRGFASTICSSKILDEFEDNEFVSRCTKSLIDNHREPFENDYLFNIDSFSDLDSDVYDKFDDSSMDVPENRLPHKTVYFINTKILNKTFQSDVSLKSGWYEAKNCFETPEMLIKRLDKKARKLPNFNRSPNNQMIGVDCEFCGNDKNSRLISYQSYSLDCGVGVIWFYKGEQPRLIKFLSMLHYYFRFKKVDIVSHYNIAEMSHFYDLEYEIKNIFARHIASKELGRKIKGDIKQRTKTVIDRADELITSKYNSALLKKHSNILISSSNCIVNTKFFNLSAKLTIASQNRTPSTHSCEFKLCFRDTYLINNRESLKQLGERLNFKKDSLSSHEISHMHELLQRDPKRYCQYAMKDSIISVLSCAMSDDFVAECGLLPKTHNRGIIPSASSLAGKFAEKFLDDIGKEKYGIDKFHKYHQGWLPYTKDDEWQEGNDIRYKKLGWYQPDYIERGAKAYYGGRNECYLYGKFASKIVDIDMKAAYPTAMLSLYSPDWHNPVGLNGEEVDYLSLPVNAVGYITLNFKYRDKIKFPNFPIKINNSLVFPREGKTTIDLITFLSEYRNNRLSVCDVEEIVYFPPLRDEQGNDINYLGDMVQVLVSNRAKAAREGDLLRASEFKKISNYTYGKTCQGVGDAKDFNINMWVSDVKKRPNSNQYNTKTPFSSIYNPVIAASVTGMVRTCMAEMMDSLTENGYTIASVTTDGFVILNDKDINTNIINGLMGRINRLCHSKRNSYLGVEEPLYEIKHQSIEGEDYYSLATRFYWMVSNRDEDDVQIAAGGIQVPSNRAEAGKYLKDCYLNPHRKVPIKRLTSLKELLFNDGELFRGKYKEVEKNYDYDRKRMVANFSVLSIEGVEKISFVTNPYNNIDEYNRINYIYNKSNGYRKRNKIQTAEEMYELLALYHTKNFETSTPLNILARDLSLERGLKEMLCLALYSRRSEMSKFKDLIEEMKLKRSDTNRRKLSTIEKREIKATISSLISEKIKGFGRSKSYSEISAIRRLHVEGGFRTCDKLTINDYLFIVNQFKSIRALHNELFVKGTDIMGIDKLKVFFDIVKVPIERRDEVVRRVIIDNDINYIPGIRSIFDEAIGYLGKYEVKVEELLKTQSE